MLSKIAPITSEDLVLLRSCSKLLRTAARRRPPPAALGPYSGRAPPPTQLTFK